jgi:radical SAM superfamily enzyme YgiQ (UPF0313 family)
MTKEVLKNGSIDFVIKGEGERVLLNLLESLQSGKDPASIRGLAYRVDGGIVGDCKNADLIELDQISIADYESFPAEKYIRYTENLRGIKALTMIASRGCPYGCSFCAVWCTMGRRWRSYQPKIVVDQMMLLKECFGIEGIWFKDSIFGLNKDWLFKFCQELRSRSNNLKWQCNMRVDLIKEEIVREMASSGCIQIDLGIESGSPRSLKTLNKRISIEQIKESVKIASRFVDVAGFFMIGIPGEVEEDVWMTVRLAEELDLKSSSWSIYAPLPGSILFNQLRDSGSLEDYGEDLNGMSFTHPWINCSSIDTDRLYQIYREINQYFSRP